MEILKNILKENAGRVKEPQEGFLIIFFQSCIRQISMEWRSKKMIKISSSFYFYEYRDSVYVLFFNPFYFSFEQIIQYKIKTVFVFSNQLRRENTFFRKQVLGN